MTQHASSRRVAHPGARPTLLRRLWTYLTLWRQRRQLAQLDSARLDDLGLSRRDALSEAARKPWDVPNRWLL
jgi:uncharacterized protein YjiS (DUF1127 family)